VSGRSHDTADGSAVADVGVGVEDNFSHAGRCFAVLNLADGEVIKGFPNGIVSNDGDGLAFVIRGRNESGCRSGGMDR